MKIKISILFLLCVLLSFKIYSQNIDSLILDAKNEINDTVKIKKYYVISKLCRNYDLELSKENAYKMLHYSKVINDSASISKSYSSLGIVYEYLQKFDSSIIFLEKSLSIAKELDIDFIVASTNLSLGVVYEKKFEFEKAMNHYYTSVDYFRKAKVERGVAMAHNNIGVVLRKLERFDDAINHYKKVLENDEEENVALGLALENLAIIYAEDKNEYKKGIQYVLKAISEYEKDDRYSDLIRAKANLAQYYIELKRKKEAKKVLKEALELSFEIKNSAHLVYIYSELGHLFMDDENYPKAEEYIFKAYELASQHEQIIELKIALNSLTIVAEKQGKFEEAYKYMLEYSELNDSIAQINNSKNIAEIEEKYKSKEKEMELLKLNNEKKIQQANLESEKSKNRIYIALIGASVIFLIFVIYFLLQKRRDNKLIVEQKEVLENQNEELNQINEEILAQRDEIERQKNIVDIAHTEIKESIDYAKRIQNAILPSNFSQILPNSFVLYLPKDVVAGDFYWLQKANDTVLFASADCTGHGVPGALVSVICSNALNRAVREYNLVKPSDILNKTRELVIEELAKSDADVKDGMDISLCSLRGNKLQYAGANNPLWILRENDFLIIKADKQPIGKFDASKEFTNHEIDLQRGDEVYLFSDGFPDQFGGPKGKKLGYKKFREILTDISKFEMEDQSEKLNQIFIDWKGKEDQLDDVCVIGFKI